MDGRERVALRKGALELLLILCVCCNTVLSWIRRDYKAWFSVWGCQIWRSKLDVWGFSMVVVWGIWNSCFHCLKWALKLTILQVVGLMSSWIRLIFVLVALHGGCCLARSLCIDFSRRHDACISNKLIEYRRDFSTCSRHPSQPNASRCWLASR